jgi:hypothetical protein
VGAVGVGVVVSRHTWAWAAMVAMVPSRPPYVPTVLPTVGPIDPDYSRKPFVVRYVVGVRGTHLGLGGHARDSCVEIRDLRRVALLTRLRSGFRVQGSGFRVQGSGFIQGAGFRAQGSGRRVQGSGFRSTQQPLTAPQQRTYTTAAINM